MAHHVLTPARRAALAAAGVDSADIIDFGHRISLPGDDALDAEAAERDKRRAAATYAERKPRSRLAEREAEIARRPSSPLPTFTWAEAEREVLRLLAGLRQDAARPDRVNGIDRARELGAERAKPVVRAQVAAADRRWAECAYSVRELARQIDGTATNGSSTARKAAAALQDACLRVLHSPALEYIQAVARGS